MPVCLVPPVALTYRFAVVLTRTYSFTARRGYYLVAVTGQCLPPTTVRYTAALAAPAYTPLPGQHSDYSGYNIPV